MIGNVDQIINVDDVVTVGSEVVVVGNLVTASGESRRAVVFAEVKRIVRHDR